MKTLYEILQFACSGFWTFLGCFFIFSLVANAIGLTIIYSIREITGRKKCRCKKCENINLNRWSELPKPIECEKCGSVMIDKDDLVLTTDPPKKKIICSNEDCMHVSYRNV